MVRVVVARERRFVVAGRNVLIMVIAIGRTVMVMTSMFRHLVASRARSRTVRMSPRGKQTIPQVEQGCQKSDELEVLARHLVKIVSKLRTRVNYNVRACRVPPRLHSGS